MGSVLEIRFKCRRIIVISIRGCYRSICNHPFLVGLLGFLLLLYRSFPFLFSVLVSASPVLVCTAVLLGTLLSFGQSNVPEVEEEEEGGGEEEEEKEQKVTNGISSFQTVCSESDTVVADRDEIYPVKGYSENRSDGEGRGLEETSLAGEKDSKPEEDHGMFFDMPAKAEKDDRQVKEGVERELHSVELGKKREVEESFKSEVVSSDEEAIEKEYVLVQKADDDIVDIENEKTSGDHVKFSCSSSWREEEKKDEDDDNDGDDDESVESGSDQAESSSPDASMADIIPMLDELHPLLYQHAPPQPTHLSRDASEKSEKSDDDSVKSDEDSEHHSEGEEDGVDEQDDEEEEEEEEEEMEGGKEDESKSAIKWTEDDQKNLMDLGSLELERNQRLENLIARRRARRLMSEKNLIDLDGVDLPCNVAPITTTRRNPFDLPDESYAAMGLPPIPGSAPSILQPRRNPFDIPYDSSEEKPDLKGDSFQQEFAVYNQKDAFFRRHESFSLGPSALGISKHERHDINWKPVFISERMASEGTSYPSLQRQSSEVSDSKLSSVPDTESVSSIDQDDDRKFSEQDLSQHAELISSVDHAADGVEHGSQSSRGNDFVETVQVEESNVRHDEVEIVLGGVENPSDVEFYPETGEVEIPEQLNTEETHLRRESSDEESSSSRSSRTSLSEVIDNIPVEKMENSQPGDGHIREPRISRQPSVEESNFQHVSTPPEPVYDSSPPAAEKLQSLLSVSSDSVMEFSERAMPPVSGEMTANSADNEYEVHDQRLVDNTYGHEENQAASSQIHVEVENELKSEKSEDINQHTVTAEKLSTVTPDVADQNGSTMADIQVLPVSVDSNLSSDIGSEKGVYSETLHQDYADSPDSNYQMASEKSHLSDYESVEEGAVPNEVSRFDHANLSKSGQDADEKLDMAASDAHHMSFNDPSEHDLQLSQAEQLVDVFQHNLPSEETEHIEKSSTNKKDAYQTEQDTVLSSSIELVNTDIEHNLEKNAVSFTSDRQHEICVKSPSNLEDQLSSSDEFVVAPCSSGHDESQVQLAQDVDSSDDEVGELSNARYKTPLNISSVSSPDFGSTTSEMYHEIDRHMEVDNRDHNDAPEHSQVIDKNIKEFDDMKEIDEGFLSELDTVGDFSVSDAGVSLHTDTVHEKTSDAQVSSLPNDIKVEEVEQDIPVLEAKSLEDINLAFKQLQEGVDVKEIILPSTIQDQVVSEGSKDHQEGNSELQVVEARSLDDIDFALKQIPEGNPKELPKSSDSNDGLVKIETNEVESIKVVETSAEETSQTPVDSIENIPVSSSGN